MTTPPQAARPRKIRLRRVALRAAVFLLLGAIVNVAVAWGCAIDIHVGFVDKSASISFPVLRGYNLVGEEGPGATRFICEGGAGQDLNLQRYRELSNWVLQALHIEAHPNQPTALVLDGRGWPFLSMYSIGDYTANEVRYGFDIRETDDPTEFYTWINSFALPMGFIWPGFAINTLFYAAILWLLSAAPFALRRRQRSKRGLCPACAYPIGTSNLCTECGASLSASSATLR